MRRSPRRCHGLGSSRDRLPWHKSLKATFVSSLGNDSESEDAAAYEAIRAAIETCEKTTALLKAELVGSASEDNELPPAKRRAVERNQAGLRGKSSTYSRGRNYLRSTKKVLTYLCKIRPLRGRSTYLLM